MREEVFLGPWRSRERCQTVLELSRISHASILLEVDRQTVGEDVETGSKFLSALPSPNAQVFVGMDWKSKSSLLNKKNSVSF